MSAVLLGNKHCRDPRADLATAGWKVQHREYTRQNHQLRSHIERTLDSGAVIAERAPLTIRRGNQVYQVACGMLISEQSPG